IGPIRYFQGLSDVMVGDEDADTAPFEVRDDPLYVDDGYGVDPREGLVEEDERGRGHERPTNFEPPPFTPREGVRRLPCHRPDPQLREKGAGPRALLRRRQPQHLEDGADVLLGGELAEDAGLLREVADPGPCAEVHRKRRDVLVAQEDLAA